MKKEIIEKMLDDKIFCNKELCKYNSKLEQENKILKKALELACESLQYDLDYDNAEQAEYYNMELCRDFIYQAKESMK